MHIELDHFLVPCRHGLKAAQTLASLLGVPWAQSKIGPFVSVFINDGLTLDFDETTEAFAVQHYCFRVTPDEFDAILNRIIVANLDYRSTPHGPVDRQINTRHGGNIVYWNEPDGHVWELLTTSYARQH